jgi:predicted MFS family arabinose efflux permease
MDHVVPIEGLVLRGTHGPRLATSGLISAIAIGFVGALFIFITPPMLALMAESARLNDSQIGYIAAWDINSTAVAIGGSTFLLLRWNWRRAVGLALGLIAVGNFATAFSWDYPTMAASRCVAGLGEGLAIGFAFAALGRARNPDRAFALYLVVGALLGAALLYALPLLQGHVSPKLLFLCNVGLTALVALSIPAFPNGRRDEDGLPGGGALDRRLAIASLGAVFLIFFAVGAVWSYAERIGAASHLDAATIAKGLSAGTLAGVLGAALAGMLPQRLSRTIPLLAASVCVVGGFQLLDGQVGPNVYLVGILLILFGWNLAQPLLSGMCSDADSGGRVVCAMGSIQTFGMGIGPALAAPMVAQGSFDGPIWMASIAMVAGLALAVSGVMLRKS